MFVTGFLHIQYMRLLLRLFVMLFAFSSFAQESISYARDVDGIYDFESIKEATFTPITDPNKGLDNGAKNDSHGKIIDFQWRKIDSQWRKI